MSQNADLAGVFGPAIGREPRPIKNSWCPGPGSNRHGVSPKGFSYPLQLSLLHGPCIWGLDFIFALPRSKRAV